MSEPRNEPGAEHENAQMEWATKFFEFVEHWISFGIGVILTAATGFVLAGTAVDLVRGLHDWPETTHIFEVVDKLLFVLMLVEILHTVRKTIQTMTLAVEPFLIVGLIASVRRILIVTVQASGVSIGNNRPPAQFDHSMIELGVLGALTLVLIFSLFLARQSPRSRGDK